MPDSTKLLIGVLAAVNVVLLALVLSRDELPLARDAVAATGPMPAPRVAALPSPAGASPSPAGTRPGEDLSPTVVPVREAPAAPAPTPRLPQPRLPDAARAASPASPAPPTPLPEPRPARRAPREALPPALPEPRPADTPVVAQAPSASVVPVRWAAVRPRSAAPSPTPPATVVITVPAGHTVAVRLDVSLHSRELRPGDLFEASLAEPIHVGPDRVAGVGTPVTGKVVEVIEAGRIKGREQLTVTLLDLVLDGAIVSIETSELTLTARDDKKRDAVILGTSTVVGAVVGGIADGGEGAAKGAAGGAAAGAGAVLFTRGRPVVLESGERLELILTADLDVELPAPGASSSASRE